MIYFNIPENESLYQMLMETESMQNEVSLFTKFLEQEAEGIAWVQAIKQGLHKNPNSYENLLTKRGLVQKILSLSRCVMIPQIDNFTPTKRTPWGGKEIINQYKQNHGIDSHAIVGESWEISGHISFPNIFKIRYNETELDIPITLLEYWAPDALYGIRDNITDHVTMPFLVKLLNSGSWIDHLEQLKDLFLKHSATSLDDTCKKDLQINSLTDILTQDYHDIHRSLCYLSKNTPADAAFSNEIQDIHQKMIEKNLSIQVHPSKGDYLNKPSKTEAWVILSAEKGAGLYFGLRQGITKEQFEKCMREGHDVSNLMNFVLAKPGDVYFIPSGTLHAIGAGILLIEPQETSESTFRAYDWGRLSNGKPRELHYDETIKVTNWESPRGSFCIEALKKTSFPIEHGEHDITVEHLIDAKEFQFKRITFSSKGACYDHFDTKFQGFFVTSGSLEVREKNNNQLLGTFKKGQSFLIPAIIGPFTIISLSNNSELLQSHT
jgi:mannose-6-phosphate isomerase class I